MSKARKLIEEMSESRIAAKVVFPNDDFELSYITKMDKKEIEFESKKVKEGDEVVISYLDGDDLKEPKVKIIKKSGNKAVGKL